MGNHILLIVHDASDVVMQPVLGMQGQLRQKCGELVNGNAEAQTANCRGGIITRVKDCHPVLPGRLDDQRFRGAIASYDKQADPAFQNPEMNFGTVPADQRQISVLAVGKMGLETVHTHGAYIDLEGLKHLGIASRHSIPV